MAMKRKLIVAGIVACVSAAAVYVVAQTLLPARRTDTLSQALVLFAKGNVQQAKDLLASIGPEQPGYEAARRYLALCMHELGDWRGFLKAVEGLDLDAPVVPVQVREELAFRQIDALFKARKFEEIFARMDAFQQRYPGSTHMAAVTEYRLASLFERGMKKAYEGAALTDATKSAARRAEAQANLVEFLALAVAGGKSGYSNFPKRNLEEDIWAARLVLGDEAALFAEVPANDVARRERLNLVRLRVYKKLYAGQPDRLLELMRAFVGEFPGSTNRPKVEYELADLSFELAERALAELRSSGNQSDAQATDKWDVIRRHHALGREMADRLLHQKPSLLEQQDYLHLCQDYLNSFYAEAGYERLASEAEALLGQYEAGSLGWVMAKVYEGVVLVGRNPARLAEADAIFRQVLSLGFRNKTSFDQWLSCAAKWRVYLALARGDHTEAEAVAKWVQAANCSTTLKQDFLRAYRALIGNSE